MKHQIEAIIKRIESKHIEDPTRMDDLDEITKLLSQSQIDAISTMDQLDSNSISWISPCFEKLAYKFQSIEFINFLKSLIVKFPTILFLKDDVQFAIDNMN